MKYQIIAKEILVEEYKTLTCKQIGEKYNVPDNAVERWLKQYDIPRRRGSAGGKNLKDLTGVRFGKLTVIKKSHNATTTAAKWLCKCDCNKEVCVVSSSLCRKLTKSCGCDRVLLKWTGYEEISGTYWSRVVKGAKLRNLDMEVTIQQVWDLFLRQGRKCALTGIDIYFKRDILKNYKLNTASLDRIDNHKGYTLDNIQWIHKDVNFLKNNFQEDELLFYCRKIVEYEDIKRLNR